MLLLLNANQWPKAATLLAITVILHRLNNLPCRSRLRLSLGCRLLVLLRLIISVSWVLPSLVWWRGLPRAPPLAWTACLLIPSSSRLASWRHLAFLTWVLSLALMRRPSTFLLGRSLALGEGDFRFSLRSLCKYGGRLYETARR